MRIGVIGGDGRQEELARLFAEDGHSVSVWGLRSAATDDDRTLEDAVSAEIVVLPLPLCKGEGMLNCETMPIPTRELFGRLRSEQLVLAGQVKSMQIREASECGLRLKDYFLREELTVTNAAITAEGAIQIAMERLNQTLLGMECLVLGFGRIGKLLCHRLQGMGANVTAAARKPEDLAWIRAYGYNAMDIRSMGRNLAPFTVVFNTVPAMILDEGKLRQLRSQCVCIDVASVRGVDLAGAERCGIETVWARSLPGKLAPRTAACAIRDTIYNMLFVEERGDSL